MKYFSKDKYSSIVTEIRDRILSAEVISNEMNRVFVESTSLQVRKILELIAYLSVLVNGDKLNSDERKEYHAKRIVEALSKKATIFYPFPSRIIPPGQNNAQPVLIPFGYKNALSQDDFKDIYQLCGKVLHAQHPLKQHLDIEMIFVKNKEVLRKLKQLLQNHTIGIKRDLDKYTFLYVEIDFTNNERTDPSFITEYNTQIYSEQQLLDIFYVS